ncbi:MAG: Gfo/Idh/MocA family oxidoreductase [Deltaproteobacteria bacterium]|nr:Gfo/Idh/MocA family oxidoreductase [Deltaproteobacteria bacterium]
MKPLTGAIVGCGMISEFHLRAWQCLEGVDITAFCDVDEAAGSRRRDEYFPNARVYSDLAALLANEDVDFIDVASPPDFHAAHVSLALAANRHVICQKPLTSDAATATALATSARERQLTLAVHDNHRFRPWFQRVLAAHARQQFGHVVHVRWHQYDAAAPSQRYKVKAPQGVLFEYGTHFIDMMLALLGEPKDVSAQLSRINESVAGESFAHLMFRYENSGVDISVGWKNAGPLSAGFHLLGTTGEVIYEGTLTRGPQSHLQILTSGKLLADERRDPTADYIESFIAYQQAFVASLRATPQPPPPITATEGAAVLAWTEAAYESARTGKPIAKRL